MTEFFPDCTSVPIVTVDARSENDNSFSAASYLVDNVYDNMSPFNYWSAMSSGSPGCVGNYDGYVQHYNKIKLSFQVFCL